MNSRRRILFVSANQADIDAWRRLVASLGRHWDATFAYRGEEALGMLALSPFDIVIAVVESRHSEAIEFLNRVWNRYPKVVRFAAANPNDHDVMARCVLGSHQFLPKSITAENLKTVLDRVWSVGRMVRGRNIKELVSKIRTFPAIPSIYFDVVRELVSSTATHNTIGALISKDMAMTTKLIQMVNSAFFGLNRQITDPAEMVMLLGMQTVRSLVLGIHAFANADKIKPIYFSIVQIWNHSLVVAESAKQITLRETGDAQMADMAYTAGLLHDIGKLVLAVNFDEQYGNAMAVAKKRNICPAEIEREIFGVTHAEVGAYLISLWGLPTPIIEATAMHHAPGSSQIKTFTPLTAVYVANVLEHECNQHQGGYADPALDQRYIEQMRLAGHIQDWRALVKGILSNTLPLSPSEAEGLPEVPPAPEPEAAPVTPARPRLAALAVGVVLLLLMMAAAALWWSRGASPVASQNGSSSQHGKGAVEPSPGPSSPSAIDSDSARARPGAAGGKDMARRGSTSALNAAAGSLPVKVQGVFYSRVNPTVVIDGQALRVGESIKEVQVVAISSNAVVLEHKGSRKTIPVP